MNKTHKIDHFDSEVSALHKSLATYYERLLCLWIALENNDWDDIEHFQKKSKEAFYNSKIILAKDDIDENFVQELLNLVNDVTKKLETLREQTQRELIVMQKAKETLKTFKSQTPINTSFIEVNT